MKRILAYSFILFVFCMGGLLFATGLNFSAPYTFLTGWISHIIGNSTASVLTDKRK